MACGGGVAWGSDNAIVRETCGRVIGGDFVLGLAVMQGARLLGLPVTQPCGDWVIFVLLGGGAASGTGSRDTVQQLVLAYKARVE